MGMEFAKYYDVTKILEKLIKEEKLNTYKDENIYELFIYADNNDFWVARVYKDTNEEWENEEGIWLIERNKINKYDIIDLLKRQKHGRWLGTY